MWKGDLKLGPGRNSGRDQSSLLKGTGSGAPTTTVGSERASQGHDQASCCTGPARATWVFHVPTRVSGMPQTQRCDVAICQELVVLWVPRHSLRVLAGAPRQRGPPGGGDQPDSALCEEQWPHTGPGLAAADPLTAPAGVLEPLPRLCPPLSPVPGWGLPCGLPHVGPVEDSDRAPRPEVFGQVPARRVPETFSYPLRPSSAPLIPEHGG